MNVELRLSMPFEQLSSIILGLPFNEKVKLKELLFTETELRQNKQSDTEVEKFRKLLLKGPVMSKEQYDIYKQMRKNFKQWTEKLYA